MKPGSEAGVVATSVGRSVGVSLGGSVGGSVGSEVIVSKQSVSLEVCDRFEQVLGNSSHQSVLLKYRTDLQSNAASTEL